ncbi:Hsp20/alpha crystallin family protein [uncultured Pontibacter sp.]|uniref:Hsp20/alpha crystallin family protein n=1 Tax=uncultured Pontibacter sp. TaxID=453356 RepID=UPI00262D41D1|nr:Hsp20/alpha crystallin family protein [uncultured Pontibacter sp.]
MKRIINKDFLHNIALHLDLFNTIGGGVSETFVSVKQHELDAVIEVWAAGVNPESFKVVLRNNNLTVSSTIQSNHSMHVAAPIFSRTFVLPPAVNMALIDATYEDGKLRIKLPYNESANKAREIVIKQL